MTTRLMPTLFSALILLLGSLGSVSAQAHGYIDSPPARGYACRLGQNTDCGAIYWEPQSLEGPDGWPQSGPIDGSIAAAGSSNWAPLNEQSATRWAKQPIQAGLQRFTWTFTAPHVSEGWRYYITRSDWDPAAPLTRDSFQPAPFCSHSGNMERPPARLTHECTVPSRLGYHVILGVWKVGDTAAAFYNVIDVEFTGGTVTGPHANNLVPQWDQIGAINPSTTLEPGDTVTLRLFNAQGELSGPMPTLLISEALEGDATVWPRLMAELINRGDFGLRAGALETGDEPRPRVGVNPLWVQAGSALVRAEVQVIRAPEADIQQALELLSAPSTLTTQQGSGVIEFVIAGPVGGRGTLVVSHDAGGEVARSEIVQDEAVQTHTVQLVGVPEGAYSLTLSSVVPATGAVVNRHEFQVIADVGQQAAANSCQAAMGDAMNVADWQPTVAYLGGDIVEYEGTRYRARWWTRNEVPVSSSVWQEAAVTAGTAPTSWSANTTYLAGDSALYRNKLWRSKWWNRGSPPSLATGWVQIGSGVCP